MTDLEMHLEVLNEIRFSPKIISLLKKKVRCKDRVGDRNSLITGSPDHTRVHCVTLRSQKERQDFSGGPGARICALSAGDLGSISGQGTGSHMLQLRLV